jgi:hypothetical protein
VEVQDKSAEVKMIQTDWRREVVWVCGPILETDTRESWFGRGVERINRLFGRKPGQPDIVGWRQLKGLFHREVTDPKHSIGERVKIAAAEARKEALQHAAQIESLVSRMQHTDEDFYREEVNAHLHALRQVRGLDRARDHKEG